MPILDILNREGQLRWDAPGILEAVDPMQAKQLRHGLPLGSQRNKRSLRHA